MLKGKLLVATPGLIDPNFFRTVVLVVEHTEEGAAGVVLNRPSETELGGRLEGWKNMAAEPKQVFVGGPVQPDGAVCLALAAADGRPDHWEPVVDGLGVVDLGHEPETPRSGLDRVRVFAGYAGWESGQLESELDQGSWYVLDADPEDALTTMPGALWRFVLRRQGGKLAMVSQFPIDPSTN